eukprot:351402-Chlamydomonas_euryale.AAC.3
MPGLTPALRSPHTCMYVHARPPAPAPTFPQVGFGKEKRISDGATHACKSLKPRLPPQSDLRAAAAATPSHASLSAPRQPPQALPRPQPRPLPRPQSVNRTSNIHTSNTHTSNTHTSNIPSTALHCCPVGSSTGHCYPVYLAVRPHLAGQLPLARAALQLPFGALKPLSRIISRAL